jgi:putative transcriptional regulator
MHGNHAEGRSMLRYKLKERIADKEFRERRRITIQEVAQATGITRNTLSKMLNQHGASVRSDNLDKLCTYFGCSLDELAEYVADGDAPVVPEASSSQSIQRD